MGTQPLQPSDAETDGLYVGSVETPIIAAETVDRDLARRTSITKTLGKTM
jgi:hypothetical protein